jgi:RNA polymerase sigma-70 factor (ECF subfamily)
MSTPEEENKSVTAHMKPKARERFFNGLLREHHPTLLRYAVRLTRCSDRAQDLTQETFAKAWRYLDSFKGGNALAWLKQVMRSVFFDKIKKDKLRQPFQGGAVEFEDYMVEWLEPTDLTLEQFERLKDYAADPTRWQEELTHMVGDEIFEALKDLSVDHREVIILYHLLDMQYDEIAKIIEAKEGTVMSRLFRARENLQKAILKRGGSLAARLTSFCASGQRRGKRTQGSHSEE